MFTLRPVRLLAWCGVALIAGHVAGLIGHQVWGLDRELGMVRQFDLNAEGNLAAWFSSFLLLASAGLCFLVSQVHRLRDHPLAARWGMLSAFLLVMAIDETSQLHDMATGPLRNGLGLDFGVLYFAWLIPALVVVGLAAVYFAPVVRHMSATVRPQLLLAAIVYLSGAVGLEMIGGNVVADGRQSLSYLVVLTLEEGLEILGGFLLLTALLNQLRELGPVVVVRWTGAVPQLRPAEDRASSATDV